MMKTQVDAMDWANDWIYKYCGYVLVDEKVLELVRANAPPNAHGPIGDYITKGRGVEYLHQALKHYDVSMESFLTVFSLHTARRVAPSSGGHVV
jgi:hypothetical protein